MNYKLFILVLTVLFYNAPAQITVKNLSGNSGNGAPGNLAYFTHLYIIEYDSTFNPFESCELLKGKNLLKTTLGPKKQTTLNIKLKAQSHYNLVYIDTTDYPYYHFIVKYYLPGNTKQITLDTKDIQYDYNPCVNSTVETETMYSLEINNTGAGNLVKFYFRFDEKGNFERCSDINPLKPLKAGESQTLEFYNPKHADTVYVKYIMENKGKLTEHIAIIKVTEFDKVVSFNTE